jgi:signal peptidase II
LRKRQIVWIGVTVLCVVAADQLTKEIIIRRIPENSVSISDRPETFFFLTHRRNFGIVGGAFRGSPVLPYVLPLLASLLLIYLFRFLHPASRAQSLAYGLIGGGAIGNLIDRFLRQGGVVDFLQVHFYFVPFDFPWKQYPAFNVADSAICVGVALLFITWQRKQPEHVPDDS